MKSQLNLRHLLWRMQHVNAKAEIVSVRGTGTASIVERRTFAAAAVDIGQLAAGLRALGVAAGATVGTLAWNTGEHFDLILAVPSIGATLNNVNPRLAPQVLGNLIADPNPALLVVDADLLDDNELGNAVRPIVERQAQTGTRVVVIGKPLRPLEFACTAFGDLARPVGDTVEPEVDEDAVAFLFHTGGTTGPPKTYEVTHRTAMLHTLSQATTDASGLSRTDRVLPLPPFCHVNGWGLPLTSALTGSSLILAGRDLNAERVATIIRDEQVTVAAGVPTIWHDVCAAVRRDPALRPGQLREVLSGGSPVPQSIVNDVASLLGASVATAWGMTETMACSTYERGRPQDRAGLPIPLVELRIVDPDGTDVSGDESRLGRLDVAGPLVIAETAGSKWFPTGDIAVIDDRGRLTLKDREGDLIKSGGEWIASAVLEQHLCTHDRVAAAVVVPVPDPRWIERPVAYVLLQADAGSDPSVAELKDFLSALVPKWWLPDDIHFVKDLPRTAVGKIDKKSLRNQARSTHTTKG